MFAPIHRPTKKNQATTTQQSGGLKRKRRQGSVVEDGQQSDDDHTQRSSSATPPATRPTTVHPLTRRDPYFVAGHDREDALPPFPFPFAGAPSSDQKTVDESYAPRNGSHYGQTKTLKRRHINNITSILHLSMLRGDWQRAMRAWSLLLRAEVGGLRTDVRRNGRWGIGAELLMRCGHGQGDGQRESTGQTDQSEFAEDGFTLARDYYQRLILQYPHVPGRRGVVDARAFYPAMFNIWLYEVCQRHGKGRPSVSEPSDPSDTRRGSSASEQSLSSPLSHTPQGQDGGSRRRELDDLSQIAKRMDEVMLSPPYDASIPLLTLRGMLGLRLHDLYSPRRSSAAHDEGFSHGEAQSVSAEDDRNASDERSKALRMLRKVKDAGESLPSSIGDLLDEAA